MASLKKNSIVSLGFLFLQSGYSAVLGLITNIVITVLAAKDVFGIYSTTLATLSLFNYISDVGLAGALIQKKEVSDDDLATVFTMQQMLIGTLIIIGFIATPQVMKLYSLSGDAAILYWAVLIGFFISSLKTIPSVLLERTVQFNNIVKVQIVENTIFYILVSVGIIFKLNLLSFALAVIVRAAVGTYLLYRMQPWRPRFLIAWPRLKALLAFGAPFQANSLLALVKDDLMVLFLGFSLGFQSLGEIMWAKKWAEAPIRIIMDNVTKVLFPLVSRMQDNPESMKKTVTTTVWVQFMALAPTVAIAAIVMPYIVEYVPKYSKWASALPLFYIFCIAAVFSTLSTPLLNVFNALKKPLVPLSFMIFWTIASWVLTPVLTLYYGPIGFAYTQLILSSTFVLILYLTQRVLGIQILDFGLVLRTVRESASEAHAAVKSHRNKTL